MLPRLGLLVAVLPACGSPHGSPLDAASGDAVVAGDVAAGCVPACLARACGDDGCGGTCGTCEIALACSTAGQCVERTTLDWAGVHWFIRKGAGGPGPNTWDPRNVWVDAEQTLHLKLAHRDGGWSCAELTASTSFGFGRFQWWVEGAIDRLDPNVVLGLFTYPTSQIGPDGTNEIDIEMARWGNAGNLPLNYTVWPATVGTANTTHASPMLLNGTYTTHRFRWASDRIDFTSVHGFRDDDVNPIATWAFAPSDPAHQVPQAPVPLHLNLWLFQGRPPTDGAEVEIKLHAFNYTPP
jgi:hypothetical protein